MLKEKNIKYNYSYYNFLTKSKHEKIISDIKNIKGVKKQDSLQTNKCKLLSAENVLFMFSSTT